MASLKSLALLASLLLVGLLVAVPVRCLHDDKSPEAGNSVDDIEYEVFEEGYDDAEGEYEGAKPEYGGSPPPPPPPPPTQYQSQPHYHHQPSYPGPAQYGESHGSHQGPPAHVEPQVSYSAPPPPPPPPQVGYGVQNYSHPAPLAHQPAYVGPVRPVPHPPPPMPYVPIAPHQHQHQHQHLHQQRPPVVPAPHYQQPQAPGQQYSGAHRYSPIDLMPFLSPIGYRANHMSLLYYRGQHQYAPYRNCPRLNYANAPHYRDIEAAFGYAAQQLQMATQASGPMQYMNMSHPSAAARHSVFSYLSQRNARMDDEGILLEFVSQYLADRLCLSKWDKQRYLPTLSRVVRSSQLPPAHSCSQYQRQVSGPQATKYCVQSKYRTYDGFCNNPYHPYWGKSNVCHIRFLSPDYADGISAPRASLHPRIQLPNPRHISNVIHNDITIEGPYNLMKMQWGQLINHDITNTALSAFDGLVDCCKQPQTRGCWPIYVPTGDRFYSAHNVTCLNFVRSGVCPLCQLGPRQQTNKNTAFLDASHVYGNTNEQAQQLRAFRQGKLRTSSGKNGDILLPVSTGSEQCTGICYQAGDSRVNQHPTLTLLHTMLLRNHNHHAEALAQRHPDWNDEYIFQEARRINIAEYQMITYNEYFPIVFGPILSAYYHLTPQQSGHTYYDVKTDPSTWNEYSTAACRFGHSQIPSAFGLHSKMSHYGQSDPKQASFPLREWYLRPSLLGEGLSIPMLNGLLSVPSQAVDPWITDDVRNHLYKSHKEPTGGDLAATNIWRGRDHGIPGYIHYIEYCFNYKVRGWKDLAMFVPQHALNSLRKLYRVPENIDLFTGGMSERHFPGADIGPTFACINGIQYYHLKFGDRFYFEHGGQAGSFTPPQLQEVRRATLSRFLCRTGYLPVAPQYAFMAASQYNPVVNCSSFPEFNYSLF